MYIHQNAAGRFFGQYNNPAVKNKYIGNYHLKAGNTGLDESLSKNCRTIQGQKAAAAKLNQEADIKAKLRKIDRLAQTEAESDRSIAAFFSFADSIYEFMGKCVSVGLNQIEKLSAGNADAQGGSSLDDLESNGISVTDPELRDILSKDTYENRRKWVENYIQHDLRNMLNFAGRFMKLVFCKTDEALGGKLSQVLNKYSAQMADEENLDRNFSADALVFFTSEGLGIDGNVPESLEEQGLLLKNALKEIEEKRNILNEINIRFRNDHKPDASGNITDIDPMAGEPEDSETAQWDYAAVIKMFEHLKANRKLALAYGTLKADDSSMERQI